MGVADWITLLNGLLGTFSIACLILAFDDFSTIDSESDNQINRRLFLGTEINYYFKELKL